MFDNIDTNQITVLGKTFNTEEERRTYFIEELRKHLPELKKMEGFPIGEDEDILNLSDPPYYTACPNPWLNDFILEWEEEKKDLEKEGKRSSDFEVDEPYAADISVGKNNPIYNAHSYHTKVPHPAIMRYIFHYTEPGDIIFDGFAGTGMTGVASRKCLDSNSPTSLIIKNEFDQLNSNEIIFGHRHTINSDLSPIASFIASNYNKYIDPEKFRNEIEILIKEIENEYSWIYETKSENGKKGKINYVIWSDLFSCPNCGFEDSFWSAFVKEDGTFSKEAECKECSANLNKKNVQKKFKTIYDASVNDSFLQMDSIPVRINYNIGNRRLDKLPDKEDLKLIEQINSINIPYFFPLNKLDEGYNTNQPIKSHGIKNVHHFYTKRNLLAYSFLYSKAKSSAAKLLLSAFHIHVNKMRRYQPLKPGGTPGLNGTLYVPNISVELSIMNGLPRKLRDISKAIIINSSRHDNPVSTQSATDVKNIISNSIDYIFTDPPFGANIMYSELNFLWEAWLKVFTNNKPEAIENKFQNKTTLEYQNLMSQCFSEYYRILKPGKWMTVEFSNTSAAIWNGIQTSLQNSGFIIANVAAIDKKQGSFKAVTTVTAVKQDLVISCYKPSSEFDEKFRQHQHATIAIWDFVEEHLHHLPIHLTSGSSTTAIIERSPKILFDRLIAFYVQKVLPVPIDASKFQQGLRERFVERDGMFFTNEQVQEYDKKKKENPEFIQLSILVSSEQDGVLWLKTLLTEKPMKYQDINPEWMQAIAGIRKGDVLPELATILEENFLKDDTGKWYAPDPENEADLEKLRTRRLLRQFDGYKEDALKPKTKKIKEVRVEALRVGFRQCYQDKDFNSIVIIGDKIPNNLLMEDEVLLQFYDIASSRV